MKERANVELAFSEYKAYIEFLNPNNTCQPHGFPVGRKRLEDLEDYVKDTIGLEKLVANIHIQIAMSHANEGERYKKEGLFTQALHSYDDAIGAYTKYEADFPQDKITEHRQNITASKGQLASSMQYQIAELLWKAGEAHNGRAENLIKGGKAHILAPLDDFEAAADRYIKAAEICQEEREKGTEIGSDDFPQNFSFLVKEKIKILYANAIQLCRAVKDQERIAEWDELRANYVPAE